MIAYYLLVLFILAFKVAQAIQEIENCIDYYVTYMDTSYQNPYLICQECKEGFILTSDFQSCVSNRSFPYEYKYCKRLDVQNECDEGLCSIMIDQYGNFFSEIEYYDPRCAKVDKKNNICLRPRFPFTLIQDNDSFYYRDNYFCQIQSYQSCKKTYGGFQLTYDANFKGYMVASYGQIQGTYCYLSNCKTCRYLNNVQPVCLECEQNYISNYNFECKINCIKDPQTQTCKICILNDGYIRKGYLCQTELTLIPNCIKSNQQGRCVQCQQGYYYNLNYQQCWERIVSKNGCKYVNPISDQCLTPECNQAFSLSKFFENDFYQQVQNNLYPYQSYVLPSEYFKKIMQELSQSYYAGITVEIFDENVNMIMKDYFYNNQIKQVQCVKNPNTIDDCVQYLGDLCIQCAENNIYYQMIPKTDQTGLYYKSNCGDSQNVGIENCIIFSQNQCLKCIDGYYLYQGLCKQNTISNCLEVEPNILPIYCKTCQKGYTLINNNCVLIPKNCIDFQCSSCINEIYYQLIVSTEQKTRICQQINVQTKFEPCIQIVDGQCTKCRYGTILQNGICLLIQSSCQQFSNNKKCLKCLDGYMLYQGMCYNPYSSCQKYRDQNYLGYLSKCDFNSSECIQICPEGQYLDNERNICTKCDLPTTNRSYKKCYKNTTQIYKMYYTEQNQAWNELDQTYVNICLDGKYSSGFFNQCNYEVDFEQVKIRRDFYGSRKYSYQFITNDDDISRDISYNQDQNLYQCPQKIWHQKESQDSLNKCQFSNFYPISQNYIYDNGESYYYCGDGKISKKQEGCDSSNLCLSGMVWEKYLKMCIYLCGNNLIAFKNNPCATTTACFINYEYDSSSRTCIQSKQTTLENSSSSNEISKYELLLIIIIGIEAIVILCLIMYIVKSIYKKKKLEASSISTTEQGKRKIESNKESAISAEPNSNELQNSGNQNNLVAIQFQQDELPEIQSFNQDFKISEQMEKYGNYKKTLISQIGIQQLSHLNKEIINQFKIEFPSNNQSSQIDFYPPYKHNQKSDHKYSQSASVKSQNQQNNQDDGFQSQNQLKRQSTLVLSKQS